MQYEYNNVEKLDSVEVTLAMGCKLDCYFCPQKLLLNQYFTKDNRRKSIMSYEDFKNITKKIKHGGTICFSGMCEAFLNPKCTDMILYAYEQGFRISLLTTLVGMKKGDVFRLRGVEFDEITLHIPDEEGNSKFDITDEYIEVLECFHNTFHISSYSCHGTIHSAVKKYIDNSVFYSNKMINRAGNLDYGRKYSPNGEIVCMVGTIGKYGNWTPEILPDGTVLLCCMDYGMKHVLGNIITMDIPEILAGVEYQRVQMGMKDDSIDILCRQCSSAMETSKMPAYKFLELKQSFMKNSTDMEPRQKKIVKVFAESKNICVFGLGKWFWNNFFNQRWDKALEPICFCDNNSEYWGKKINNINCISPELLNNMKNLLVVLHIKDDNLVREQLKEKGIRNVINIQEIYNIL